MPPTQQRVVAALVLTNLALQLFDGIATYVGVHAGFNEGNPLLYRILPWQREETWPQPA